MWIGDIRNHHSCKKSHITKIEVIINPSAKNNSTKELEPVIRDRFKSHSIKNMASYHEEATILAWCAVEQGMGIIVTSRGNV